MNLITLNGKNFDVDQLSPDGQRLLNLINEAQSELARLETQKVLLNSAQQQLIQQLKPLLPPPVETQALVGTQVVLGKASDTIPTTSVIEPELKPSPLPDNIS